MSALVLVALLGGCATEKTGQWSIAGALEPIRAQLDQNSDGKVDQAEYDRVAFTAPPFAVADADADADLSLDELRVLVRDADPVSFFHASAAGGRGGGSSPAMVARSAAIKGPIGDSYYVLLILREEVAAADPAAVLPSVERVEEVGMRSALDSPEAKELLRELEEASARAGVDFPPSLKAAGVPERGAPGQ